MRKIISHNYILIGILIVAAILRFVGTNPGYNQFHADEGITYSAATSMIVNHNLDPLRYDYPALIPLINYLFFRAIFIPLFWCLYYFRNIVNIVDGVVHVPLSPLEADKVFRLFVLGERYRNALFWGRYVTALFSLGNVLLTYILAKKIFSRKVALVAALFLTFNYKHVINSHIGLPDIYNAFFVLLAILAAFKMWKNQSPLNYFLAGLAAGLTFTVKYQFFGLLPIALAHLYAVTNTGFNRRKLSRLIDKKAVMAALVFVFVVIAVNPYHLLGFEKTLEIVKGVSLKYGMGVKKLNLYPFWYFFNIDYGPVEFVLVALGIIFGVLKYRKNSLLLLSHVLPFMFVMIYYSAGGFYVRNFITTTPLFMIFAAVFVVFMYDFTKKHLNNRLSLGLLALLLVSAVFIPGRNAVINSYYYTKPWGYGLMSIWIDKYLPKDATVATHPFDAVNLKLKNKHTEFEVAGAFSMSEHIENGASYLIMDLNWVGYPFYFWMNYGINELPLYFRKPYKIMRNTFHGIASEEFFRYQLYAVTKPWQAPDTHIVVIKFPIWPKVEMNLLKKFDFDNNMSGWKVYWGSEGAKSFVHDPDVGKDGKGSISYVPSGSKFSDVRATSEAISIAGGHLYNVKAYLKTEKLLGSRERDGFIRIDFYKDNPDFSDVGQNAAVSSRVYGTSDWVNKEITERAPDDAKYLTVSFQMYITTKTKVWLDDVSVYESIESVPDITQKDPYHNIDIDLNYVYPNSHGNL